MVPGAENTEVNNKLTILFSGAYGLDINEHICFIYFLYKTYKIIVFLGKFYFPKLRGNNTQNNP